LPTSARSSIEDVGNATAFLMSDLASGVSAEIMYVDGGFSHMVSGTAEDGGGE
jgi:enoyl-[acyl-carrier protein] reductase I